MHYKSPDNSVHFIEPGFEHLLPAGSVEISEAEAKATLAALVPVPTAKDLLAKLDADNALSQRNLRETILLMSEAFKQLSNGALDLTAIPGVKRVKDVEAQAAVLRNQL